MLLSQYERKLIISKPVCNKKTIIEVKYSLFLNKVNLSIQNLLLWPVQHSGGQQLEVAPTCIIFTSPIWITRITQNIQKDMLIICRSTKPNNWLDYQWQNHNQHRNWFSNRIYLNTHPVTKQIKDRRKRESIKEIKDTT